MAKFRLNHNCRKPGCVGNIGDVIEATNADVEYLLKRKGGALVDVPVATEPVKEAEIETATVEPPENAATRTGRQNGRAKK